MEESASQNTYTVVTSRGNFIVTGVDTLSMRPDWQLSLEDGNQEVIMLFNDWDHTFASEESGTRDPRIISMDPGV